MKIGLVCPYDINKGGGVQEQVVAQQRELSRLGHDVYIITPLLRRTERKRVPKTIFLGTSADFKSPLGTTVQVSAGINEEIDEMLKRHKFDVLHFHEPWVPMLSMQILSRSKSVNVATFHAKLPETMMSRTVARVVTPYTKSILGYIHKFMAVSDAAADYLRRMSDVQVSIVPNGIDLNKFRPPRIRSAEASKEKIILYIGRLEPRKGLKYLLYAFAQIVQADPVVKLKVIGDGSDRRKMHVLTENLGIEDRVEFLGYQDNSYKIRMLRSADLFCAPSLYGESFGVVLLEAMATNLVTVAGDNPGYEAVLKDLGAISLVNPKHTDDFARRLQLLLGEPALRRVWQNWAKKEVRQYGFPQIAKRYEEVYKQVLETHSQEKHEGRFNLRRFSR